MKSNTPLSSQNNAITHNMSSARLTTDTLWKLIVSKLKAGALLTSALAITACSSMQEKTLQIGFEPGSCVFDSLESAPDWYCAPDRVFDADYVFETGSASGDIIDKNFQRSLAFQNARLALARKAVGQVIDSYIADSQVEFSSDEDYQLFKITLTSQLETELNLPPVQREAMIFDTRGKLYMLVRAKATAMDEKIKQQESKVARLFNAQIKQMTQQSAAGMLTSPTAQLNELEKPL